MKKSYFISLFFFVFSYSFNYSQSELLLKQLQKDFSNFPLIFNRDSILNLLPENWILEDSSNLSSIRANEKSSRKLIIYDAYDRKINYSRRYCADGKELSLIKFCAYNRLAHREFRKATRNYRKHFAKVQYKKRTIGFGGFWTERRFYLNKKDKLPYMSISWCPRFDMATPTMEITLNKDINLNSSKKIERHPKF